MADAGRDHRRRRRTPTRPRGWPRCGRRSPATPGPSPKAKTYEWVEPYREAVRRQAVDAHTALADALAATDPAEAAAVLQAAIGHDPYNDALYQQAMRLHARLGDSDAIRAAAQDVDPAAR